MTGWLVGHRRGADGCQCLLDGDGLTVPTPTSVRLSETFSNRTSMTTQPQVIRTSGSDFLGPDGKPLLLRGVCLGGWLNMENFITGYAANETLMRREVRAVIGDDRADRFFERLLTRFFDEPDAAFLGGAGVKLPPVATRGKHPQGGARPVRD